MFGMMVRQSFFLEINVGRASIDGSIPYYCVPYDVAIKSRYPNHPSAPHIFIVALETWCGGDHGLSGGSFDRGVSE